MTFTINEYFIYYWIFSILFECTYLFFEFRKLRNKYNTKPEYEQVRLIVNTYMQMAAIKLLYKKVVSPVGLIGSFVFLSIVSPFVFPFTLISLFKTLIGYKSKLEKQVELETKQFEEAKKWSDDFMKNEGIYTAEDFIDKDERPI